MSSKYFTLLCTGENIAVPSTDKDVRSFLTNAGATFGGKSGNSHSAIRSESAAAVAWARTHLNDDGKWVAIPSHAATLLQSLFPIKASIAKLGGDKWTPAVRALIRAQITPVASPEKAASGAAASGSRISARQVAKSLTGALNAAALPPSVPASAPSPNIATSAAQPALPLPAASQTLSITPAAATSQQIVTVSVAQARGGQTPYQTSSALEAILSPARLTQLYLGESWTLEKRANRDKQMARVQTSQQFDKRFEDPADPLWAHRIAFRRGTGSAITPDAVNQDGKNIALALRWESIEVYTTNGEWNAMQQLRDRATRVGAAWERFAEAIDSQQGVPQSVLRPILMAIKEVLALRVREASTEVGLLGPAGQEIVDDMRRQQTEVAALFTTYEQILAAQLSNSISLQDMARRTNGVWWALLEPSVKLLCPERAVLLDKDALVTQAEGACAARHAGKRPRIVKPASPPQTPMPPPPYQMPPPTMMMPQPMYGPWGWPGGPPGPPGLSTLQVPLPPPAGPPPPLPPAPIFMPQVAPPTPRASPTPPVTPPTQQKQKFIGFPSSAGILGPARGNPKGMPQRVACDSCSYAETHGRHECPKRFFERFQFPMPGFSQANPQAKDPAAWAGADITPATAAAWRTFLEQHPDIRKAGGMDFVANLS